MERIRRSTGTSDQSVRHIIYHRSSMSLSEIAHPSAPDPLLGSQDCLGPVTASEITSTDSTGWISWGSWMNTPPFCPNQRGLGARYHCGASVIGTTIQTSAGLGGSNGYGGRLCIILLDPFRWTISVNADPLEPATAFPYLGFTVAFNNSNWAAVYQNIRKARNWWDMVEKLLKSTGATVRVQVIIYKALVQTVLLYGKESWVVTGAMLKLLEGFHHWVARRILRNVDWCTVYK